MSTVDKKGIPDKWDPGSGTSTGRTQGPQKD